MTQKLLFVISLLSWFSLIALTWLIVLKIVQLEGLSIFGWFLFLALSIMTFGGTDAANSKQR